jgi:hypothetical protein
MLELKLKFSDWIERIQDENGEYFDVGRINLNELIMFLEKKFGKEGVVATFTMVMTEAELQEMRKNLMDNNNKKDDIRDAEDLQGKLMRRPNVAMIVDISPTRLKDIRCGEGMRNNRRVLDEQWLKEEKRKAMEHDNFGSIFEG